MLTDTDKKPEIRDFDVPRGSFFVTGGTVPLEADSYVTRQADTDLLDGLLSGEYCYVLNTRQMGKSSLSVRTIAKLNEQGVRTVFLDLTKIGGQNATPDHWYAGLLSEAGRALNLRSEFVRYWKENAEQTHTLRFFGALREIALSQVSEPLVLFVDEIDAVRSLPFPTDEFFAAIRECYTARATQPEMRRLTFCLLGVATPADLISDTRMSPFNIGRRIELRDFTAEEAAPLAQGLGNNGGRLLSRVLYWASGHPYLTQRLCRALAEEKAAKIQDVDRLADALFLSKSAQQSDDNLAFVRNRLLRSEVDLAALLDLYRQVRGGKRVKDDETNPLVPVLRLSGVARVENGLLKVRNRIYDRVFDKEWVLAHMPDAELRRQKAAYRRGLLRAALLSGAVLAAMGVLTFVALRQTRIAGREAQRADFAARREAQQRQVAEQQRYVSDMNVTQQAVQTGNMRRAMELLTAHLPKPGGEDLRGWEWRYLWRLRQGESRYTFRGHVGTASAVAFSPDGTLLASGGVDGTVRLLDAATGRQLATLQAHEGEVGEVHAVAFSPDGSILASGGSGGTKRLKLWDVATRREIASLGPTREDVLSVAFSPDGKTLAAVAGWDVVRLWDVRTRREKGPPIPHRNVRQVAYSPDGKRLLTGGFDEMIRLWDVATRQQIRKFHGHKWGIFSVAFSPDGRRFATGSSDSTAKIWDADTGREVAVLTEHRSVVTALSFSSDGKTLATGSVDGLVKIWEAATGRALRTLRGHAGPVWSVAFAPTGGRLASAGGAPDQPRSQGEVRLWETGALLRQDRDTLPAPAPVPQRRSLALAADARLLSVAFSPDSQLLATMNGDRTVTLWDVATRRALWNRELAPNDGLGSVAFSPDGRTLAGSTDGQITLWDVATAQVTTLLRGPGGALVFSRDGKTLITGNPAGFWNVAMRRWEGQLTYVQAWIDAVAVSPDGKRLAQTGSESSVVHLWNPVARREVSALPGHIPCPDTVAFSPDSRLLASGGFDNTGRLFETTTGKMLNILTGHVGAVYSVAFSPDGKTLATGSQDRTVKLWNVATRREMLTLEGHKDFVTGVAFSPDGRLLASISGDNQVRLWRAAAADPAADSAPTKAPARSPATPPLGSEPARALPPPGKSVPTTVVPIWTLEQYGTAKVSATTEGNAMRVEVTAVDGVDWHTQVVQVRDDLREGVTYTLQFRARADKARAMRLWGQKAGPGAHGIGLNSKVSLTKEWQTYRRVFTAKKVAPRNRVPTVLLGEETGTVWLADVSLTRGVQ